MLTQYFFLGKRLLASGHRKMIVSPEGSGRPLSLLFYCDCCGETYARCPVQDDSGRVSSWSAVWGICEACSSPTQSHIPGSLWHYDRRYLDELPLEVLQREFDLAISHFDRNENVRYSSAKPSFLAA